MALFSSVAATTNLKQIENKPIGKPKGGREFDTYTAYKTYLLSIGETPRPKDNWYGQDGYWLKSERENAWLGWRNAVYFITYHKNENYLQPFGQIMDYYKQVHFFIAKRKHEIRWLNGAYYLVEDLWEAYEDGITPANCVSANEVIALLKTLNVFIANYAIGRFHELLFGRYKNSPMTGIFAYIFDRDFIVHEQGAVAYSAYLATYQIKDKGPLALREMSRVYNDQTSGDGFSLSNFLKKLDVTGIFIPVYRDYYYSDLADLSNNFGQDSRIQAPLGMLHVNKYFMLDTNPLKIINEEGSNDLNMLVPKENLTPPVPKKNVTLHFRAALLKGSKEYVKYSKNAGVAYTEESILFAIYHSINKKIMEIFTV